MSPRGLAELWPARSGAVIVEHLIVFLPTLFFCLATIQTILLCAGDLVVRRAASAAARAAVVILPDPIAYGGAGRHQFAGARRDAVVKAARMILAADPHFDANDVAVTVTGASGEGPLTATVRARYQCFASFVNIVCGGSSRELKASSTQVYHGADYAFE
jgi:hypothetical protein